MPKKTKVAQSYARVSYTFNPLTTHSGRVGFLSSVRELTRSTAVREAIETAMVTEIEPRPYRKPVVAQGRRYESITAAARDIRIRDYPGLSVADAADQERRLRVNIGRWCREDNREGYYWSE